MGVSGFSNRRADQRGATQPAVRRSGMVSRGDELGAQLIVAIKAHDIPAVRLLCEQGADVNFFESETGKTGLHYALPVGAQYYEEDDTPEEHELALFLLEQGADPNLRRKGGESAFHHAARTCSLILVNEFLKKGANPDLENNDGESPFLLVALSEVPSDERSAELLEAMLRFPKRRVQLQLALQVCSNSARRLLCDALIRHGANPVQDILDVYGNGLDEEFDYDGSHSHAKGLVKLTAGEKHAGRIHLSLCRACYMVKDPFQRRKNFMLFLRNASMLPRAPLPSSSPGTADHSAALPPIPRGTATENREYLLNQVFTNLAANIGKFI